MDWAIYENLVSVCGSDKRERILNHSKEIIRKRDLEFVGCKDVVIGGQNQKLVISNGTSDSEKKIKSLPDETFYLGDYVQFREAFWLVTSVNLDDEVFRSGSMTLCNFEIRWQRKPDNEIISRWCVAESSEKASVDTQKVLRSANEEFVIKVPYDEETSQIDINRLLMICYKGGKQKTYRVTNTNPIDNAVPSENKGYIVWNVRQTAYSDEKDNPELLIADYDETKPTEPVRITYSGLPEIRIGNRGKTFIAETDKQVTWRYVSLPADTMKISAKQDGNKYIVKVDNDFSLIGKTIKVVCSVDGTESALLISIIGGV